MRIDKMKTAPQWKWMPLWHYISKGWRYDEQTMVPSRSQADLRNTFQLQVQMRVAAKSGVFHSKEWKNRVYQHDWDCIEFP